MKPLPVIVAAVLWLGIALACVGVMEVAASGGNAERSTLNAERSSFPDVTITPDLTIENRKSKIENPVIRWAAPVDDRPFLVRLMASLRLWGEVGTDKGKARVDEKSAEVSATYRDQEKPSPTDLMPQSAAIGVSGGADF